MPMIRTIYVKSATRIRMGSLRNRLSERKRVVCFVRKRREFELTDLVNCLRVGKLPFHIRVYKKVYWLIKVYHTL